MTDYYVKGIIKCIEDEYYGDENKVNSILKLEMVLSSFLSWDEMKTVKKLFKENPKYYAELVDQLYIHDGDDKKKRLDKEKINVLFDFYHNANFCPCEEEGNVDLSALKNWVSGFKKQLVKQKQDRMFGYQLGKLFAYSPIGSDGVYPHESVRIIIEKLRDKTLLSAYVIAESNKRGVHIIDAGRAEREMALKYKSYADSLRIEFPECSKIYLSLYDNYMYESENERKRAEDVY